MLKKQFQQVERRGTVQRVYNVQSSGCDECVIMVTAHNQRGDESSKARASKHNIIFWTIKPMNFYFNKKLVASELFKDMLSKYKVIDAMRTSKFQENDKMLQNFKQFYFQIACLFKV